MTPGPPPITATLDVAFASIAKALASFQAEMPTVAKTRVASIKGDRGSYSYSYAGLAELTHAAIPLLTKHGLSFICVPEIHDGRPVITGMLLHSSGQSIAGSLPLAVGSTPQATGSAITYARRYLFGCLTGIVTDDDDDGALASKRPAKKAERLAATPDDDPWYDTPPREAGDRKATKAQMGKLHALFTELGITDRDKRLLYANDVLGLTGEQALTTSNQLTVSTCAKVIDALEKDAEAPFPAAEKP